MIDPKSQLSISRQAGVLGISRGSVYYQARPTSDADLKLMRRIDELHMELPFAGSCEFRFNPAGDSDLIPATIPI